MLITSIDNNKIKNLSLLKNNKERNKQKLFLVEGLHLVEEALKANRLQEIIVLENNEFDINVPCTYVTNNVMKKLTNMDSIPRIIGVCNIKENQITGDRIILLDNIQDPGNLGTIIRSSKAFNIDTIVLSNDTVDLYNDKVIRSTQGMLFNTNVVKADLFETINYLKNNNYTILSTNVNNGKEPSDVKVDKYALIMGNEGNGVNPKLQELADINLYIPMNKNCESLNVGVATSIIIYELNRGKYE